MQVQALAAPLCLATATVQGPGATGMFSTLVHVVQRENISGLWRGTSPSLQRSIPGIGVYFTSLHLLKTALGKTDGDISALQALAIGATARSFTACTFIPFTVVKTRFESGRFQYHSVINALTRIGQTEGVKGLFSGLSATLVRDAPFSGIYLLCYTQSKQMAMRATKSDHLSPPVTFACGVTAGLLASITTQPADVIKTSIQVRSSSSVLQAVFDVFRRNGVRGMFVGILPRATRKTLMAAFTWSFYEQIVLLVENGLDRF